jgi:hypothetical protein
VAAQVADAAGGEAMTICRGPLLSSRSMIVWFPPSSPSRSRALRRFSGRIPGPPRSRSRYGVGVDSGERGRRAVQRLATDIAPSRGRAGNGAACAGIAATAGGDTRPVTRIRFPFRSATTLSELVQITFQCIKNRLAMRHQRGKPCSIAPQLPPLDPAVVRHKSAATKTDRPHFR